MTFCLPFCSNASCTCVRTPGMAFVRPYWKLSRWELRSLQAKTEYAPRVSSPSNLALPQISSRKFRPFLRTTTSCVRQWFGPRYATPYKKKFNS